MYKLVFVFPSTGAYQGETDARFATEREAIAYAYAAGYNPATYYVEDGSTGEPLIPRLPEVNSDGSVD